MKPGILLVLSLSFISGKIVENCNLEKYRTYEWSLSTVKSVNPNGLELVIFCYKPRQEGYLLLKTWSSATFSFESLGEVELYSGDNHTDVACQHEKNSNVWLQTTFNFWKSNSLSLKPFNKSCVGALSKDNYEMRLTLKAVDLKLAILYFLACILFLLAPELSRNIVFYYGTGVSIGLFASLLIIAFVAGRVVPKRSVFYCIFFTCFSISAYIWNFLYGNLLTLLNHYHHYVIAYVLIVSTLSFAVCYYRGPISNPRVFKLIQWTIQLSSLVLLFCACQLPSVAIATAVALLAFSWTLNFKMPLPKFLYRLRYRLMPPSRKLLSLDEYHQEGVVETRKALEELRQYCNSPECNTWRTVSRLHSPTKFADWVEGGDDDVQVDDYDLDFGTESDDDDGGRGDDHRGKNELSYDNYKY